MPEQLRRRFSARSRVVEAAAGERIAELEVDLGRSLTPAERRGVYPAAVLSTRKAKDLTGFSDGGLHDRWATTAVEAGLDPERWLRRVVGHRPGLPSVSIDAIVADSVVELSRSQSTWARTDVVRQVLRRTPPNLPVVVDPRRWVERVTDEVLAHPEVVRLAAPEPAPPSDLRRADGLSVFERHGAARYSTRATLATEQHVLDLATAGRGAGRAIAHRVWVEGAIDEAGLGKDQAKAVRRFTLSGDAISCLVGPAGTGKSRAVGAAATAWRHSGTWVLGLAVSATAAGVLRSEAGISTETVAKLLYELDRRDPTWALRPGGVVIVDEAAMVASSDLARLATFVERSGSKLVLVGDHAQLGAVDAGGLFRLLVADGPAELAQVHRFEHSWERSASLGLRNHDPEVVDTYVEHGRVAGGDATAILDAAFDHWQRARALGDSVVVCAGDRATVEALSQRARAARVAAGEVEAGGVEAAGQRIGVGDEVVTCRNDRRLVTTGGGWVRNGDRWTVTARHLDDSLTVEDAAGRGRLRLPADYVGDHISLAYAVTVHKAQGLTVDRAVLIADNRTSAEALYVGMTRGRRSNHALVVCDQELEHRQPSAHPADLLRAATQRQGAERAATDELRHQLGRSDSLAVLGPRLANLDAWIAAEQPPDRSEDLVAVLAVRSRLEQCEPPSRLTRLGRAHRYHVQRLDQQQADLQTSEQERQRWLEDHSETIAYRDGLARSVEERRRQLGADAARLEPDHVVSLLGPRPDQPEDADRWTRRASAIESYREAWGVDPSRITIAPTDRTQRHAWECSIRPLQLEPPSAVRAALDLGIDPPVHRNAEYDHGIDL